MFWKFFKFIVLPSNYTKLDVPWFVDSFKIVYSVKTIFHFKADEGVTDNNK
jgi:hypothetical protein